MAWFIGQSLVFIIVAFLLGLLVGWLWWGRRRPAPAVAAAEQPTAVLAQPAPAEVIADEPTAVIAELAPAEEDDEPTGVIAEPARGSVIAAEEPTAFIPALPVQREPEPEPEPEAVPDDDLERIEGIGPKMSRALRAAGIRTYAKLAASDEATLRTAIENAGLNFAPSIVTWARQARLLADGDEEGFADLTRRLVAGRDTGRV